MKYSKSESAYFRNSKKVNSIKGGKLKENGKLENSDFSGKNGNNVVPKQKFKVKQNSNMGVELQNMNPNIVGKYKPTNSVKPIKIMIQQLTDEPFLFFGYNPKTDKYNLVCYNNKFNSINPIKCKKLVIHKNGSSKIVKLSHTDFLDIGIEELIVLCYHFLKIRKQNHGFMDTLYEYLSNFVFEKVLGTQFQQNSNNHKMYRDMVKEIGKMVMDKSSRMLNKRGGKLDVDGKLDSNDFDVQQNIQNQTVFPKEIIKKGIPFTDEPYIFFGYNPTNRNPTNRNPTNRNYRFVCYNRDPFSKTPVFRRLEDNGEISRELPLEEIKKIDIIEIAKLYCFLNGKNSANGYRHMSRLQDFILNTFRNRIPFSNNKITRMNEPEPFKEYIKDCFISPV